MRGWVSDDFINRMLSHFRQALHDAEVLLTWRGTLPAECFERLDEDGEVVRVDADAPTQGVDAPADAPTQGTVAPKRRSAVSMLAARAAATTQGAVAPMQGQIASLAALFSSRPAPLRSSCLLYTSPSPRD